jgi:pyrimidine-nucleoside phosphorylase
MSPSNSPSTSTAHLTPQYIISKKRENKSPHTPTEISWFIRQFSNGNVKDYQMTAWLMAICINGMTDEEVAALTEAMVQSGEVMEWSCFLNGNNDATNVHKVDKHSTGGVGDKASLILAPLVASFGLIVPMMAGRGLGHTGGTIDKLESIPGFQTQYSAKEFANLLLSPGATSNEPLGVAIVSPSKNICPADKRMYALRDVTSTVTSLPLQTSSIMSKKIAERPDSLVLDVKFGKGSFNSHVEESLELAKRMIQTGELCGIQTTALVTRMDDPLGCAVGNWLEVKECIDIMTMEDGDTQQCELSKDLIDVTLALSGQMLVQGGKSATLKDGIAMSRENLINGKAWEKFKEMVVAQGGDLKSVESPNEYPQATFSVSRIGAVIEYCVTILETFL